MELKTIPGDLNRDGVVNWVDAKLLFTLVSAPGAEVELDLADVNKDGKVNNRDVLLIFHRSIIPA